MALFSECHNEMGYTLYFHYETCLNERFLSSLLNTYKNSLASIEIHGCKNKLSTCLENTFHHYSVNEKRALIGHASSSKNYIHMELSRSHQMVIFRKYINDIAWSRYNIRIDYFKTFAGLMCLLCIHFFFETAMINKKDTILNLSYPYHCLYFICR